MLYLTPRELTTYASERGFLKNEFEKALRLLGILREIVHHPFLKSRFVLKGGTALNLFVYDMPRLSVDVDLNYMGAMDKFQMEKERKEITHIIPSLFSREYEVCKSKDEYALLQYEFRYQTVSNSYDKLKLDINFLHRLPISGTFQSSIEKFGLTLDFPVLEYEELLAGKVVTLLSRCTPRDLYDIYQTALLSLSLDSHLLRTLIRYYGIISRAPLMDLFQLSLDRVSDYDVRRFLYPMLVRGQYPDRQMMVAKAQDFIAPFLSLSVEEKEELAAFYNTGDPKFEFLFPQGDLRNRILRSPSLAWKIDNIKQHLRTIS